MNKITRVLAAAALGVGATLVFAAGSAQAGTPTCNGSLLDDSHAQVRCTDGHGTKWAPWVKCTGSTMYYYGVEENYGPTYYSVGCPTNKFVTSYGYQANNGDQPVKLG